MTNVFTQLFGESSKQIEIGEFCKEGNLTYGVFSDGLYEKEKVPYIGTFHTLKNTLNIPSIPNGESFFIIGDDFIPIPYGLYKALVLFYKKIMTNISSEVMAMIILNKDTKKYRIHIPDQKVSGATVQYVNPTFESNEVYVMGSHSHVAMEAFYSSTDDRDEQRAMFYNVIGRLNQENEAKVFRAKKGSFSFSLTIEDLFDLKESDEKEYLVSDLNLLKIEQIKYPVIEYKSYLYTNKSYNKPNETKEISNSNSIKNYYDDFEDYDYYDYYRLNSKSIINRKHKDLDSDSLTKLHMFIDRYKDYYFDNFLSNDQDEIKIEQEEEMLVKLLLMFLDSLDLTNYFYIFLSEEIIYNDGETVIESEIIEDDDEEI